MQDQAVREALRLSVLSIAWTVVTSTIAIGLGVSRNSVVLIAYGSTGLLDAAGSAALVVHFRHALHHDSLSGRHERIAHRIVTGGLVFIGLATAIESVRRLLAGGHPQAVIPGVVLASASVLVLAVLSGRKRRLGRIVPSAALVADGWLSATGALMAVVTVLGTALGGFGWWWADPVAATVVATASVVGGIVLGMNGQESPPRPQRL